MKLQYLAVIFVIIILPITLVFSFYTQSQIDTLTNQTNYKSKLNVATYDAIKSFQINTTNSYYSSVSDSKIRDIEASINSFYNSLTTSLNYTKSELEGYVPAIVYTLYDGYYIYGRRYNVYHNVSTDSSTGELTGMNIITNTEGETNPDLYEYGLKPFVYYSCRYKKDSNNDFVVNFTLDNFISIYGKVKGSYVTKSGYLIQIDNNVNNWNGTYKGITIKTNETLTEYLRFSKNTSGYANKNYQYVVYQNQKIYFDGTKYFLYNDGSAKEVVSQEVKNAVNALIGKTNAQQYYKEAYEFSKWVNDNIGGINQDNIVNKEKLEFIATGNIFDMVNQDPEDKASTFNQHRIAVIKNSIETNLITAINSYNLNSGSYAYALPKLEEEEWEKVVNNVCIISFMQGLPIGGKYFNSYVVMPNDKNNEFVDIDSVYLLTNDGTNNGKYHLANCPLLIESSSYQDAIIGGYINTSFERQTVDEDYYYYRHVVNGDVSKPYTPCYHCIVNASGKYDLEDVINNKIANIKTLRQEYLTILAREKYNLYKTNN